VRENLILESQKLINEGYYELIGTITPSYLRKANLYNRTKTIFLRSIKINKETNKKYETEKLPKKATKINFFFRDPNAFNPIYVPNNEYHTYFINNRHFIHHYDIMAENIKGVKF
jgi:hypothetical protein